MWLRVLAFLSGVSFSGIAIGYRLGQTRRISAFQVALGIGAVGVLLFGVQAPAAEWLRMPGWMFAAAALVGAGQYAAVRLVQAALVRGPLSPPWCAVALSFAPAIAVGILAFGERMSAAGVAGVVAGILCVAVGSLQHRGNRPPGGKETQTMFYGLVLFAIFITNALNFMFVEILSRMHAAGGLAYIEEFRDPYLASMYAALTVLLVADLLVFRPERRALGWWAGTAALAGTGAVVGMCGVTMASVELPAHAVFTLSAIGSILTGSVVSVVFFREKATGVWYAMVGLGVLSGLLVTGQ